MSYITPAQFRSGLQEAKDYADSIAGSGNGGEVRGVQSAYIVGDTPFSNGWLSLTDQGEALSPQESVIYLIRNNEDHYNRCVAWNGQKYEYVGTKQNTYHEIRYVETIIPTTDVPTSGERDICVFDAIDNVRSITVELTGRAYNGGSNPYLVVYSGTTKIESIDLRGDFNINKTYNDMSLFVNGFRAAIEVGSASGYRVENASGTVTEEIDFKDFTENYVFEPEHNNINAGLVPPALPTQSDHILFGDGKWKDPDKAFGIQNMVNAATSNMQSEINSFQLNVARNGAVGEITAWLGAEANVPQNYLVCKGQTINRLDYPQLYNVLYTLPAETRAEWGNADWIDTFNLPDLRGEFLHGINTSVMYIIRYKADEAVLGGLRRMCDVLWEGSLSGATTASLPLQQSILEYDEVVVYSQYASCLPKETARFSTSDVVYNTPCSAWYDYGVNISENVLDCMFIDDETFKVEGHSESNVALLRIEGIKYADRGISEFVYVYPVGSTPYSDNWLSDKVGGNPIKPNEKSVYVYLSDDSNLIDPYVNTFYRFVKDNNRYRVLIPGPGYKRYFQSTYSFSTVATIINDHDLTVMVSSTSGYEGCTFLINIEPDIAVVGDNYVFSADFELSSAVGISNSYSWCFAITNSNIDSYNTAPANKTNLPKSTDLTNLSHQFTMADKNYFVLYLSAIGSTSINIKMSNISIQKV